jgi:WASH complex subunit 7
MFKIECYIRVRWRQLFARFQKRQVSMKYSDRRMNLNSSLKLISLVARSEFLSNNQGRNIQSICLSMLLPFFNQQELLELNQLMDLMRVQSFERIRSFTDCSHLYWHIQTIDTYYTHAFEELNGATNELSLLHLAFRDIQQLFTISNKPSWSQVDIEWLLLKRNEFLEKLSFELVDQFKTDYLDRVCQELEVELRIQTHKDLCTSENSSNPVLIKHGYDFKQILCKDPAKPTTFCPLNNRINLTYYVEKYLNKVCYDLTALAPHDWFAYDDMMNLARHKYGLKFVDAQLPALTLDSGFDLLDITRNLSLFASRYSYDLTNQLFIEKCSSRTSVASSIGSSFTPSSSSQLLNIIKDHHIAQSIHTHGYGTLDSAINCTYQALKRLIDLFSRQLSDDKLRAVLQKEYQQMIFDSQSREKSNWTLSFDRANKIAKQFRLNMNIFSEQNQKDETPNRIDLDSIRQTVTQIGNLLAFVRLIKSGALTSASKSVDYVPEMNDLSSLRLKDCVEYEFADYESQKTLLDAAENFDQCLDDLQNNFSPKTNYSKIIVDLFSGLLSKSTQQDHLDLFYLVVPALIINYIDHLINCKERASLRSSAIRFGALLSDDGFAIGVAFLLTVLDQTGDHNKLDWLGQTCSRLRFDIDGVSKRLTNPSYEESLKQTSSMTMRRLNKLHAEYVALDHTLMCALLLFENLT